MMSQNCLQATLTKEAPRLLNSYCLKALLDACTHEQKVVDEANVGRAAAEFDEPDRAAASS